MESLNWVDLWMHLTLCLTAYLALSLSLPAEKLSKEAVSGTCVAILAVNCLYLAYWAYRVVRLGIKHLALNKRGRPIARALTCGTIEDSDGRTLKEIERQEEDHRQKELEQQNLEKIDNLLGQLTAAQQELLERSAVSITDRSGNNRALHTQLLQEVEQMLGEHGIPMSENSSNLATPRTPREQMLAQQAQLTDRQLGRLDEVTRGAADPAE
jgi:hypothetical protein